MLVNKNLATHSSSDFLFINDAEIPCRIGTTPKERAFPQTLTVSIEIRFPLREAGSSGDLKTTVDYAKVIDDCRILLASRPFALVESVAETIADKILSLKLVKGVSVHVAKKAFPGIRSVGAHIFREKNAS